MATDTARRDVRRATLRGEASPPTPRDPPRDGECSDASDQWWLKLETLMVVSDGDE